MHDCKLILFRSQAAPLAIALVGKLMSILIRCLAEVDSHIGCSRDGFLSLTGVIVRQYYDGYEIKPGTAYEGGCQTIKDVRTELSSFLLWQRRYWAYSGTHNWATG